MTQTINLMHAGLSRRHEPYNSAHLGLGVVAAIAIGAAAAGALHWQADREAAAAAAIEQDTQALQVRAMAVTDTPAPSSGAAELQRLRAADAGQRQLRAAIASGTAGRTEGYAEIFTALARQSQPTLWITGFAIAADGVALELQGRMADPRQLPDYLRRLNAEPLFKGREFSQLSLKAVEATATASGGYAEFALRGLPVTPEVPR